MRFYLLFLSLFSSVCLGNGDKFTGYVSFYGSKQKVEVTRTLAKLLGEPEGSVIKIKNSGGQFVVNKEESPSSWVNSIVYNPIFIYGVAIPFISIIATKYGNVVGKYIDGFYDHYIDPETAQKEVQKYDELHKQQVTVNELSFRDAEQEQIDACKNNMNSAKDAEEKEKLKQLYFLSIDARKQRLEKQVKGI